MQRRDGTSTSSASTRRKRTTQVMADVLQCNLKRLSRRTGLPLPKVTEAQRRALVTLFLTAWADAVAHEEKIAMLEGLTTVE